MKKIKELKEQIKALRQELEETKIKDIKTEIQQIRLNNYTRRFGKRLFKNMKGRE